MGHKKLNERDTLWNTKKAIVMGNRTRKGDCFRNLCAVILSNIATGILTGSLTLLERARHGKTD